MIMNALCDSFKCEILEGIHRPEDVYMIALYEETADLGASTRGYTPIGEVPAGGGYTPGGQALVGLRVGLEDHVGYLDWIIDPTWSPSTIAAAGALIYNSSRENKAVAALDFGGVFASIDETFGVILPAPGAMTALIRIT